MEGKAEKRESADVASLADLIAKLEKRLEESETKSVELAHKLESVNTMRMAKSPRDKLKAMTAGEERSYGRTRDSRDPTAQERPGFAEDDIVRLRAGTEKATTTRAYLEKARQIAEGAPLPLGIVLRYMYTTKQGKRKYKVEFPGVGKDGVAEDELELA